MSTPRSGNNGKKRKPAVPIFDSDSTPPSETPSSKHARIQESGARLVETEIERVLRLGVGFLAPSVISAIEGLKTQVQLLEAERAQLGERVILLEESSKSVRGLEAQLTEATSRVSALEKEKEETAPRLAETEELAKTNKTLLRKNRNQSFLISDLRGKEGMLAEATTKADRLERQAKEKLEEVKYLRGRLKEANLTDDEDDVGAGVEEEPE